SALVVDRDQHRADAGPDPARHLLFRERRLLRLDLLLRRARGDARGHASAEDAAWAGVEPPEHGGAGRLAAGGPDSPGPDRRMDPPRRERDRFDVRAVAQEPV